jgi:hypothetical protein
MAQENALSPFPDILASKETKATEKYGKQYAKAIWGTFITNSVQYNLQRQRDIINRQYAEGFESIEKFKMLKGIPNTSYLNLDFSPVNIIATTVDKIVGRMIAAGFRVQCNAIDPEAKSQFDDARNELYTAMFLKPYSDQIEQKTGIPLIPKNKYIPESDDEAELHMQMNFKEDTSAAMEEAFNFVLSNNMFEQSREKVLRDLVVIKRAAIQRFYDEDWNLRVERVDPVDIITPYSKYDDFRNIPYIALIKSYTIGEIAMMKKFTDEQIYNMAKTNAGLNNNPAWRWGTSYEGYYVNSNNNGISAPYYNFNIQVLEYYFLAIDKEVREFKIQKGRRKRFKTLGSEDARDPQAELIEKDIQNLYQGKWIINTDFMLEHKKAFNIPREKINGSYSPKATLPIKVIAPGIFDMKNKSHVERMIPHEDAINLANLAFQTMLIKAKPPGVAVDVRGLMDAAKGLGDNMKPIDILKIYEQTGNLIFSSITEENDVINNRVITELRGGVSDAFRSLIEVWQFKKQQIFEVVGINPNADPGTATPNVGLGVQDNAIQATNDSLRPLFNAHLRLVEASVKEVGLMIQDCIEYDNEAFIGAIGAASTKVLTTGKRLAMAQMGIKVELLPDEKEKQEVLQMLQLGQQSNPPSLTPSDVFRINQMMKQNTKLAAQLLVFLEAKNRKEAQKASQALQQQNGDIQQQSAAAAAQNQAQLDQTLTQNKIAVIQAQAAAEDANAQKAFERLMALQELKNQGMETVAEIGAGGKVNVQDAANKGKVVSAQVAADSKIEAEHIKHHSNVITSHMDNEAAHILSKYELENAPKPVVKKK